MSRGHEQDPLYSLSIRIWAFTVYFSGKRRSLLHPNKAQRSFFPFYNLILRKIFRKNAPKGPRKYLTVCGHPPLPPGQSIILLKSNLFNMAAVLVKRSIRRMT